MGVLTWIVLGLIVAAITTAAAPGRGRGGFLFIAALSICGALLGAYVGGSFMGLGLTGVSRWSILLAVAGSLLFLAVHRMVTRLRAARAA
jgi:uncharacterized membrane protein YeaQ/YmgE (transglycosylase-associated protein family)